MKTASSSMEKPEEIPFTPEKPFGPGKEEPTRPPGKIPEVPAPAEIPTVVPPAKPEVPDPDHPLKNPK